MTDLTPIPAPKSAKPTISQRAREHVCPNCGGPVVRRSTRGPTPTFCDAKGKGVCKKEHANRHIVEGRAVIAFLKAWRIDRAQGEIAQKSFEQICRITDQFNAEDKEAGRPRADLYAAKMLADGTQFFDRQHQKQAAVTRARIAAREAAEAAA
jgi:predicted RNA-binding Zn-ribbon protein involved in translation (DUF1610 family)